MGTICTRLTSHQLGPHRDEPLQLPTLELRLSCEGLPRTGYPPRLPSNLQRPSPLPSRGPQPPTGRAPPQSCTYQRSTPESCVSTPHRLQTRLEDEADKRAVLRRATSVDGALRAGR